MDWTSGSTLGGVVLLGVAVALSYPALSAVGLRQEALLCSIEARAMTVQAQLPPGAGRSGDADARDQYRLRIQNDLHQKEIKLSQQEVELSAWQEKIKKTHHALLMATSPQPEGKEGEPEPAESESQQNPAQLSKDLEAQTYYAMIAREAVLASRRDVNGLRLILARMGQAH